MAGAVGTRYPDAPTRTQWAVQRAKEHRLGRPARTLLNHIAELADGPDGCPQSREKMVEAAGLKRRTLEQAAQKLCRLGLLIPTHLKGRHVFYRIAEAEIHAMLYPATAPSAPTETPTQDIAGALLKNAGSNPKPQKPAVPAELSYEYEDENITVKTEYDIYSNNHPSPSAGGDPAEKDLTGVIPQDTEYAGSTEAAETAQPERSDKDQEYAGAEPLREILAGSNGPATQTDDPPTNRTNKHHTAGTEDNPPLSEWDENAAKALRRLEEAVKVLVRSKDTAARNSAEYAAAVRTREEAAQQLAMVRNPPKQFSPEFVAAMIAEYRDVHPWPDESRGLTFYGNSRYAKFKQDFRTWQTARWLRTDRADWENRKGHDEGRGKYLNDYLKRQRRLDGDDDIV